MNHAAEFRRCLDECDVPAVRALWAHVAPELPQPRDDAEALASIHGARTYTRALPFWKRAYSHSWLVERGLPSGLPDHLRPRAERLYPRVVDAVGIAVRGRRAAEVQRAMGDAVLECRANGDSELITRARMREVQLRALKGD